MACRVPRAFPGRLRRRGMERRSPCSSLACSCASVCRAVQRLEQRGRQVQQVGARAQRRRPGRAMPLSANIDQPVYGREWAQPERAGCAQAQAQPSQLQPAQPQLAPAPVPQVQAAQSQLPQGHWPRLACPAAASCEPEVALMQVHAPGDAMRVVGLRLEVEVIRGLQWVGEAFDCSRPPRLDLERKGCVRSLFIQGPDAIGSCRPVRASRPHQRRRLWKASLEVMPKPPWRSSSRSM